MESLEFLFVSLPLTPHQIGIGKEITLISSTPHASKVFTTPIATFENTFDRHKIAMPTSFQILNQAKPLEESVEPIEGAINQLVAKDQANLGLWTNILRMKCSFQSEIMFPKFNNM